MQYFRLLLLSLIFCCGPIGSLQSEAVYPEGYWAEKQASKKHATRLNLQKAPPLEPNKSLGLVKVAFYLTFGVAIALLIAFNLPILFGTILLFPWLWFAGLIWFLAGIIAMLGVIMILASAELNDFMLNQQIAAYLIALFILRLLILIAIGILIAETGAVAILLITAMPAFIAYFIAIRRSLKYHKSRKEAQKFWKKKKK
jgi:hypothetical protein